ncbi:MAG: EamA family transporter [Bacteroidia bacterium]
MKSYKLFDFVYILMTVLLTVFGQLVFKWRMDMKGEFPQGVASKFQYIIWAYLDPWIISGFIAAFLASMFWSITLTKFELSFAYPFTSLSFILVLFLSTLLFKEPFTMNKLLGVLLIIGGLIIISKNG